MTCYALFFWPRAATFSVSIYSRCVCVCVAYAFYLYSFVLCVSLRFCVYLFGDFDLLSFWYLVNVFYWLWLYFSFAFAFSHSFSYSLFFSFLYLTLFHSFKMLRVHLIRIFDDFICVQIHLFFSTFNLFFLLSFSSFLNLIHYHVCWTRVCVKLLMQRKTYYSSTIHTQTDFHITF